jgi:hypothetical protein
MKTIIENPNAKHNSRTLIGAIILIAGMVLLVDQLNLFFIPDWLFSWPMILILAGLYTGAKHNFMNKSWIVLVALGGAFLLDEAIPGLMLSNFIWPAALIILGIYFIMRYSNRNGTKAL